jgi:hypothetical protein
MLVRGVVFGLIAVLAILVAAGVGGTTTDQKGALQVVAGAPFGRTLVVLLAIGLGGYALWQLAQGFLNTEGHDQDAKGWLERVGAVGTEVAYAILCAAAVQVLLGAVAAGLLAYAAFCVAEARYREVPTGISDRSSARRDALRSG